MCPRVLPALLCAAAAATTSHVVDNFTSTEGMFTLTSQVPPVSTTEVSSTNAGVRLDYSSHHLEMYSGFPYAGRLLGQGNYPCAEASYLKLEYGLPCALTASPFPRVVNGAGQKESFPPYRILVIIPDCLFVGPQPLGRRRVGLLLGTYIGLYLVYLAGRLARARRRLLRFCVFGDAIGPA